ncbi:hypothetical protein SKAU_G00127510 [Synaphobranchus kaupii]|uniref:Uncharacterized protein n=1 Tax=Synaphobranchus kaupii TaxID=118154 RepID=A0A9Q1J346_SYNKA|nr:hypothetical protein SKAU_G00127510 [Synaphobranchus kaupii]
MLHSQNKSITDRVKDIITPSDQDGTVVEEVVEPPGELKAARAWHEAVSSPSQHTDLRLSEAGLWREEPCPAGPRAGIWHKGISHS